MREFILKLARRAIESYVKDGRKVPVPEDCPEECKKKRGVFVTVYKVNPKMLRGCIGFPYPQLPLAKAVIEAAVLACRDPRFPALSESELKEITIEVSILTEPQLVEVKSPRDYLKIIKIGEDGLIVENGGCSGLLLPQVAAEQEWNAEEFLENLCLKAGLTVDSWMDPDSKIYKFQARIVCER